MVMTNTALSTVPRPIDVGPEMTALGRFFPDVMWKGEIHEGGMGPRTPVMIGIGHGSARPLQDGRWIAGDYEQDQFTLDGTYVLTWKLHWVCGWSPETNDYRASMVDNYGHAMVCRGWIDGDALVFESLDGAEARLRFTWDASSSDAIVWRNEMALPDGQWFLVEEYPMLPVVHG
jgi:hypothetical protein